MYSGIDHVAHFQLTLSKNHVYTDHAYTHLACMGNFNIDSLPLVVEQGVRPNVVIQCVHIYMYSKVSVVTSWVILASSRSTLQRPRKGDNLCRLAI